MQRPISQSSIEFITLIALMMSLVALSIDAILPALAVIGAELGKSGNDSQLIISSLFLGLAIGQLIYGPLSDSIGRKPTAYLGIFIFILGTLCCFMTSNYSTMIIGRFLQGLGGAGPRIVSVAMVRDKFEGREMARTMSFAMTVFILVPVIAPLLGQGILFISDWRSIFILFLTLSLLILVWFQLRQNETLKPEQRTKFSIKSVLSQVKEVCKNRVTFGYAITSGLIFGSLLGYINSAQQMFQNEYHLGTKFPLYFAFLALSIGAATLLNAQLVMRYGMLLLSRYALIFICVISSIFFFVANNYSGQPALWMLMIYLLLCFFCIGILFGNLNAIAMQPMGHIAGTASAVIGSLSTFVSVPAGVVIGQCFDGTVLPLVTGFLTLGLLSLAVSYWADQAA